MAIDKPPGWMLVPMSWQNTGLNLHAALASSIGAGDYWARSRGLKTLRYIHRLDAETTGILLLGKSAGAVNAYSDLFESREVEKTYLAVVHGTPKASPWTCQARIAPDPRRHGRMKVDIRGGKEAETSFRTLQSNAKHSLIECHPLTGRTHQIRLHLAHAGHPVVGDDMYGIRESARQALGLRAVELAYRDPFTRTNVRIMAPKPDFLKKYGFAPTE
jgi:RluA family pseudouridine synthase